MNLCGHATLSAASVLFASQPELQHVSFSTLSGTLHAARRNDQIELDFPADQLSLQETSPVQLALSRSAIAVFDGAVVGVAVGSLGCIIEVDASVNLAQAVVDPNELVSQLHLYLSP